MARKKKTNVIDEIKEAFTDNQESQEEIQPKKKVQKTKVTKAPETKAATTQKIFTRQMAVLRQNTIPAKYNKVKEDKYITPTQGNYQNDPLDPYENQGIEHWVVVQNYATRYPIFQSTGFTGTNCTVSGTEFDFTVTIDDNTAGASIVGSNGITQEGWGVIRAKVRTTGDVIVSVTMDGETIPVAGGINRVFEPNMDNGETTLIVPMYLASGTLPTFTFDGENGSVIEFNDFEFYRVAHNIA